MFISSAVGLETVSTIRGLQIPRSAIPLLLCYQNLPLVVMDEQFLHLVSAPLVCLINSLRVQKDPKPRSVWLPAFVGLINQFLCPLRVDQVLLQPGPTEQVTVRPAALVTVLIETIMKAIHPLNLARVQNVFTSRNRWMHSCYLWKICDPEFKRNARSKNPLLSIKF